MRIIAKIVLTILVFIVATPISVVAKEIPFLNIILLAGIVGGIVAIWKYNPNKEKINNNKEIDNIKDPFNLDKS
jgi:accessory gene regulator protein AgrB